MTDAVVVGYVHSTELPFSFYDSMRRLTAYDMRGTRRMVNGGELGVRYGTGGIADARNKAVAAFLASPHPWLLWIDTDMGFGAETVDMLVDSSDPDTRPIMGALCFISKEMAADGMGGRITFPVPTVFDWRENVDGTWGFLPRRNYERDAVIECDATGSACILIHRSVFETLEAEWYTPIGDTSEDLSFCKRATAAGFPIHINTAVRTSHFKPMWLSEMHYDLYRAALGENSALELAATGNRLLEVNDVNG